jgi:hypothetical protein
VKPEPLLGGLLALLSNIKPRYKVPATNPLVTHTLQLIEQYVLDTYAGKKQP